MQISVRLTTKPWSRTWPMVIVVVIIVLITARWEPGAALPLGLGGWLGSWLAAREPAISAARPWQL
jgi:hypothetical protein